MLSIGIVFFLELYKSIWFVLFQAIFTHIYLNVYRLLGYKEVHMNPHCSIVVCKVFILFCISFAAVQLFIYSN